MVYFLWKDYVKNDIGNLERKLLTRLSETDLFNYIIGRELD